MSKESKYIAKRRLDAFLLSSLFFFMRIFPIKKNKVVFSTFEGDGGFCCNPKFIAMELHKRMPGVKIVWLTRKSKNEFPNYAKVVNYSKFNIAYHLSTAKVWVDNYRKPYGTLKRKKQLYIQTWHASMGFKAVGLYRGDKFPKIARLISEWDSNLIDYIISNSEYCNQVYPKKLLYNGPTLMTGSPRVDCLINNKSELYYDIRKQYEIDNKIKLILFAPTFRGGNQSGKKQVVADYPSIDFNKLIEKLETKYNSRWNVLVRLHPQLSAKFQSMIPNNSDKRIIDVSQAPDISEILAACDMVITDYSSCAFDAMFGEIPVLLYSDDVNEYIENRGQFMWKGEELPFLLAETESELYNNINEFDMNTYISKSKDFMKQHGVVENGKASKEVTDTIVKYVE